MSLAIESHDPRISLKDLSIPKSIFSGYKGTTHEVPKEEEIRFLDMITYYQS